MISVPSALRKVWKPRLFTNRLNQPGFFAASGAFFDPAGAG